MSVDLNKRLSLKTAVVGLAAAMTMGLASYDVMAKEIKPRIIRFGYGLADSRPAGQAVRF